MKKFFSLLILVALFATMMILVACDDEPIVIPGPNDADPHEHSFTKQKFESTCAAEGYTEYTCRDCGYSYRADFEAINVDNHKCYDSSDKLVSAMKSTTYNASNCQEVTVTVSKCTACGVSVKTEGKAGAHQWDLTHPIEVVDPTCTENGRNVYGCTLCDETKTDTIPAPGHLWNDWVVDVEATCDGNHTTYGSQHRTCKTCELREDEIIIPHHGETVKEVVAPGCTTVGYTIYVCDGCGADYIRDYRDALGHKWSPWHDCEIGPEFETRECPVCGLSEIRQKTDD